MFYKIIISFLFTYMIPVAAGQIGYYLNAYPFFGSMPVQQGVNSMLLSDDTTMSIPNATTVFTGHAHYRWAINTLTPMQNNISALQTSMSNAVLTSGTYSNPAWITAMAYSKLTGTPTILTKAYQGITLRSNAFSINKSAVVASGVAVFYLTDDGTSTGNALFTGGIIVESINFFVNDATASYQISYALTNSNKTLTATANKYTTANILSGVLGQTAANGATVNLSVTGY